MEDDDAPAEYLSANVATIWRDLEASDLDAPRSRGWNLSPSSKIKVHGHTSPRFLPLTLSFVSGCTGLDGKAETDTLRWPFRSTDKLSWPFRSTDKLKIMA